MKGRLLELSNGKYSFPEAEQTLYVCSLIFEKDDFWDLPMEKYSFPEAEQTLYVCSLIFEKPYTNLQSFWKLLNLCSTWFLGKFSMFKTVIRNYVTFESYVISTFWKLPQTLYEPSLVFENAEFKLKCWKLKVEMF